MLSCPRGEVSLSFFMNSPPHASTIGRGAVMTGGGWDKAAVGGDKRCFYKLGIALVIVHLVEALEHAVHDLHKK